MSTPQEKAWSSSNSIIPCPPSQNHAAIVATQLGQVVIEKPVPDKLVLSGVLNAKCFGKKHCSSDAIEQALVSMTSLIRQFQNKQIWKISVHAYHRYSWQPLLKSFSVAFGDRQRAANFEIGREYKSCGKGFRLKITFNPRKLGAGGVTELSQFLNQLQAIGLSPHIWFSTAFVTGIDIAINCNGIRPEHVLVQVAGGTQRLLLCKGHLETEYIEKPWSSQSNPDRPRSTRLVRVYDRREKLLSQGKDAPFGVTPITRIEFSPIMAGKCMTLQKVTNADCLVTNATVCLPADLCVMIGEQFKVWATLARAVGPATASALLEVGAEKHDSFNKAWIQPPKRLFELGDVWVHWKSECEKLGLLAFPGALAGSA